MDARFFTAAIRLLTAVLFVLAQIIPLSSSYAASATASSTSSAAGSAKVAPPSELMQVLSYQQLMALKPAQREQYIASIRTILVELEALHRKSKPNGYFAESGNDFAANLGERIAWLDTVLPYALAEEENVSREPANSAASAALTNALSTQGTDAAKNNSQPLSAAPAPAQPNIATVLPARPSMISRVQCAQGLNLDSITLGRISKSVCYQGRRDGSESCNEGFVPVRQQKNGKFTCITKASYNQFENQADRETLRKPNDEAPKDGPLAAKFAEGPQGGALAEMPAPPAPAAGTDTAAQAGTTQLTATAPGPSCEDVVKVAKCDDPKAVSDARAAFKADGSDLSCIYAGTFQQYRGPEKKVGTCPRPTRFCLGVSPSQCGRRSGSPASTVKYKCDAKGEVLCNPLVFGVQKGDKGICIKNSKTATKQCAEFAGEKEYDFLNRDEAGLQPSWDEFAKEFSRVCTPGDSSVGLVHCEECKNIRAGLLKANVAVANGQASCANLNWETVVKSLRTRTGQAAATGAAPSTQPATQPAAAPASSGGARQ